MIRELKQKDLPSLLRIEQAVHVLPWTLETFHICLKNDVIGFVLEIEDKIVGFILLSFVHDESHVLNVAIMHAYQHQGYGQQLMQAGIDYAVKKHMNIIYLEVRRSNLRAISLYRRLDFQVVGERKDYYALDTGHEDALIFAKRLSQD